jgi:phage N-6-adenine-methyltransferase
MPAQRPGLSETEVCTPLEFLSAVRKKLHISDFTIDLAASPDNSVARRFYTRAQNALVQDWAEELPRNQWGWLNPPYNNITPWVKKSCEFLERSRMGAGVAVLVPSSTGANWWRDYVYGKCLIVFLNGRIQFVGHKHVYPKDLALLLYCDQLEPGDEIWTWRNQ